MFKTYSELKKEPHLWDCYTCKDEYNYTKQDKHGRFQALDSKNKSIDEPIVSRFLVNHGFRINYPEEREFAICLTHDVDEIFPPIGHKILSSMHFLKKLDVRNSLNQFSLSSKRNSPYINFEKIMDLENKYQAKSTFFLIATDLDILRFRYNVEDIESEIGTVIDGGWEIGLHGGYYAFDNLNEIRIEKQRLESVVGRTIVGYRNHYLRFKTPDTWRLLSEAGFRYDTTFGFPNVIGFRNGLCHPFNPYDLNFMSEIGIIEIPMAIMDMALFTMSRSYEEALVLVKKLINVVRSCSGVLVLNWHNTSFNCPFRETWSKVYEAILKYATESKAWLASGEEIWRLFDCSDY